jgi:hypothetical protein
MAGATQEKLKNSRKRGLSSREAEAQKSCGDSLGRELRASVALLSFRVMRGALVRNVVFVTGQ